jgi:hypothetical protein
MKTASFAVPVLDQNRRLRLPSQLKSIETALANTFGGYSSGSGKGHWRGADGNLVEDTLQVYEIAFPESKLDVVGECARRFARLLGEPILVNIAGEAFVFDAREVRASVLSTAAETQPSQWPRHFDAAIQTVIGAELQAAQDHFQVDHRVDVRSINDSMFYKGKTRTTNGQGEASVVIYC